MFLIDFSCNRVNGGTCPGDSGGPLLTDAQGDETFEIVVQQIGVLHGGLEPCSHTDFPSIYTRLDEPSIYQWLRTQIRIKNFWPNSIGNFYLKCCYLLKYALQPDNRLCGQPGIHIMIRD